MQIVPPISVTPTNLVSSSIPENDAPVWAVGTTYASGATVIYENAVFESLVGSNTGNQPDVSPDEWLRLGATNRYKAFDKLISDPATSTSDIVYTIGHNGTSINSVALFGLVGLSATVTTVDSVDGTVFSETFNLLDESAVIDWFTYFFSELNVQQAEVLTLGIPPYTNAETTVTITTLGGVAKVGQIVLGRSSGLGVTVYNTSLSIEDYSRKERDQFGNAIIVERAFAQLVDFDIQFETPTARYVQRTLGKYRATPVVWVGSEDPQFGTIVYGYYRRFDITLSSPSQSDATIEVEGLI